MNFESHKWQLIVNNATTTVELAIEQQNTVQWQKSICLFRIDFCVLCNFPIFFFFYFPFFVSFISFFYCWNWFPFRKNKSTDTTSFSFVRWFLGSSITRRLHVFGFVIRLVTFFPLFIRIGLLLLRLYDLTSV